MTVHERILRPADALQVQKLIESRTDFLGISAEGLQEHRKASLFRISDLLQNTPRLGAVFGLFDGDELIAAIITLNSINQPAYFLNKAYTRPGASLASLSTLFSLMINHYEDLGYKRFYSMYRSDVMDTYQRLWRCTEKLKGYVSFTELALEPNERPKHQDIWELLSGRTLYPHQMLVRGFIKLDEQYRIWE